MQYYYIDSILIITIVNLEIESSEADDSVADPTLTHFSYSKQTVQLMHGNARESSSEVETADDEIRGGKRKRRPDK